MTTSKCPSCSAEVDTASSAVCPNCGDQLRVGPAPTVVQPQRKGQKISASVLVSILIDRTGSTGAFAVGVPIAATRILDLISAKARQVKVYVFTGGDLDYNEQCELICNGVSAQDAIAEVSRIQYSGGGDAEETHADSVETVSNRTPWELDKKIWRNALVIFLTADSKSSRSGVTAQQLGEKLKRCGVLVYLVAEDYSFARELAASSEGLFFAISNDPRPEEMQQIAAGISQSILITATSSATRPMTLSSSST